jgi:hypothetical protein
MSTTNYFNTLILPSEDCPLDYSAIPSTQSGKQTVAEMQYEMLVEAPNIHTSDDVLFEIYAARNSIKVTDINRELFFSKGQPCLRASPLTKRYGWAIFNDSNGKVSLISLGSKEYNRLLGDTIVTKKYAMRNKRK